MDTISKKQQQDIENCLTDMIFRMSYSALISWDQLFITGGMCTALHEAIVATAVRSDPSHFCVLVKSTSKLHIILAVLTVPPHLPPPLPMLFLSTGDESYLVGPTSY
jgi:hypothetical protein